MKYVNVAGTKISAIGLGTWQFGSGEWGYGSTYAAETAPRIVERCLELGVNLFDSAEAYGFGRSETILGKALAGHRKDAFIATKLFPVMPVDPIVGRRARASVRRLGIESIDLYQVHWKNPAFPIGPTMQAFAKLRESGVIQNAGVSNFSLGDWQAAEAALGAPVVSNQVKFSLIDRGPESKLLPWAQVHDRMVIAYSPLAQGLLSGRYDVDHVPSGLRARTPPFLAENLRRLTPVLDVLGEVSRSHDATQSQVALAWLIRKPNVVVIPGASSVAQVESNIAAADLELTDEEDRALTEASDQFDPIRGSAAVGPVMKERAEQLAGRFRRAMGGLRS